ncbi:flavin reductase family protein [Lampropedia puyangensis]|uniref:Flavin reductase family protein n=2 Tax=Lampropedia puyangensis TaxID=1330072 RepID=A0A4S8F8N4_9BURK|nr:flavin reductase family protein [Lampropedia puyangensis]THU02604.1 flavin reductase family protein [Lampropedia puyangensis]
MEPSALLQGDFSSRQLRDALGMFATGVTVVTTVDAAGVPVGLTINSFSAVSLEPPLILWSLVNTAGSRDAFLNSKGFVVNVLAAHQHDLAMQFASRSPDRFLNVPITRGTGGLPLLSGALAWFECKRYAEHLAGDHTIFIGQVQRVGHQQAAASAAQNGTDHDRDLTLTTPLLFHRGILHRHGFNH